MKMCSTASSFWSGTALRICFSIFLLSLLVVDTGAWPYRSPSSKEPMVLEGLKSLQRLQTNLGDGDSEEIKNSDAKRALSLFAHWRPHFTGESHPLGSSSDFVSAVARGGGGGRPLGQPLRWG